MQLIILFEYIISKTSHMYIETNHAYKDTLSKMYTTNQSICHTIISNKKIRTLLCFFHLQTNYLNQILVTRRHHILNPGLAFSSYLMKEFPPHTQPPCLTCPHPVNGSTNNSCKFNLARVYRLLVKGKSLCIFYLFVCFCLFFLIPVNSKILRRKYSLDSLFPFLYIKFNKTYIKLNLHIIQSNDASIIPKVALPFNIPTLVTIFK